LIPLEPGKWIDEQVHHPQPYRRKKNLPASYSSLLEAVQVYEQDTAYLAVFDRLNEESGLTEWCVRQSFTLSRLPLTLKLPPDEHQRLVRLADFACQGLEAFVLEALYKHLAEVEKRYTAYQEWEQRQQAVTSQAAPA
jgi:predicted DNA-binding protein